MLKKSKRAESYINGPIAGSTRAALIRSLTELLGDASSDKDGTYWGASYEEKLREIDLKLARVDRDRRFLVAKRRRLENELHDVEVAMENATDYAIEQFSSERDIISRELDEIYLSIAETDRERKRLKAEKKRIESVMGY